MIIDYLKKLTFLSKEEIEDIEKRHLLHPEDREAHRILAREVISDLHGEEEFLRAEAISKALFSGKIEDFSASDVEDVFKGLKPFVIDGDILLIDLLVNAGICSSKREAREFISNSSITLNGKKVTDLDFLITKNVCIGQKYMVIRRGKKKYYVVTYV